MPRTSTLATIGAVLLLFSALQIWRPYFFLTDDNMSGILPLFADIGGTLRDGAIPKKAEHLYAGEYDLWRDPGNLSLLFPAHLAGLLLASTGARLGTLEAIALVHLLVGALAMAACMRAYCRRFDRLVPDWMACFLGVSYVTSSYSLAIGSSWYNFLGNQAALPIVALGLVTERRRAGLLIVTGGMLYNLLGGHLAPFLFCSLFLGLLALALTLQQRGWQPIVRYVTGSLAALLLVAPVLYNFISAFLSSGRNTPSITKSIADNLPFPALLFGATLGLDAIGPWHFAPDLGYLAEIAVPIAFSATGLLFLVVLGTFRKFRVVEWSVIAILLLVALFVQRPLWLQGLLAHIPFFRSLRWPMRETLLFIFFAHLLVALGWYRLPKVLHLSLPPISAAAFFLPLFLLPSPTFNRFPVDRALLLSGRAEQTWQDIRALLSPHPNFLVVPLINADLYLKGRRAFISRAPHTLLGAYNYPALFGMKSSTGYTMPGSSLRFRGNSPVLWPGYFALEQFAPADLADPHLLFSQLVSYTPIAVDYRIDGRRVRASFPNGINNPAVLEQLVR